MEVFTPIATMTNKFVSVFVVEREGELIVTDGGRLVAGLYGIDTDVEEIKLLTRIRQQVAEYFELETTSDHASGIWYFKKVSNLEMLAAAVFDVAHFLAQAVNSDTLEYRERVETDERDRFKSDSNRFLKERYEDKFEPRYDIGEIRFSAAIKERSRIHLLEYITGSTSNYIQDDMNRAIVHFNMIKEGPYSSYVGERIALVNDKAKGYPKLPITLVTHLQKQTSKNIVLWSERSKVFEFLQIG